MEDKLVYKQESYEIIGACMEVHKYLGHGFLEVVYKDALEYEFKKNNIPFSTEVAFEVVYKNEILKHCFYADFVVYDKIILEIKSYAGIVDEHIAQTINYLKVANCKLGLLVNFGRMSLEYKRLVY